VTPPRPCPAELVELCHRVAVAPGGLHEVIQHAAEILYLCMFGASNDVGVLGELAQLERTIAGYGLCLPPAQLFSGSSVVERHGWGEPLTQAEISRWRIVAW
jgi:hypothetical protein